MKTTKKTAIYVLSGFGGLAIISLILWFAGVFKTGEPIDRSPSTAEEMIYGR